MIVLGIDPGTLITGYGIIETGRGTMSIVACGAIRNEATIGMPKRLKHIFDSLTALIETHHPAECALETAFYGKNAQSALKLGQARGVCMLAAVAYQLPTQEYSPREVKKAIVGHGTASKEQVQYMVKALLHLKEQPPTLDVTDALGVAICHLQRRASTNGPYFKSWKAFVSAHPELSTPVKTPGKV